MRPNLWCLLPFPPLFCVKRPLASWVFLANPALPPSLSLSQNLPIYVAGVSSGASFAMRLPSEMPGELSGIISEVLAIPNPSEQDYDVSDVDSYMQGASKQP